MTDADIGELADTQKWVAEHALSRDIEQATTAVVDFHETQHLAWSLSAEAADGDAIMETLHYRRGYQDALLTRLSPEERAWVMQRALVQVARVRPIWRANVAQRLEATP